MKKGIVLFKIIILDLMVICSTYFIITGSKTLYIMPYYLITTAVILAVSFFIGHLLTSRYLKLRYISKNQGKNSSLDMMTFNLSMNDSDYIKISLFGTTLSLLGLLVSHIYYLGNPVLGVMLYYMIFLKISWDLHSVMYDIRTYDSE